MLMENRRARHLNAGDLTGNVGINGGSWRRARRGVCPAI